MFDNQNCRHTKAIILQCLKKPNHNYTPAKLIAEMDFGFGVTCSLNHNSMLVVKFYLKYIKGLVLLIALLLPINEYLNAIIGNFS